MTETAAQQKAQILFVDDEENILRSIRRLLIDEPYDLHTATSGQDALELLGRNKNFSVIVSDQQMPGMTGVEFLEKSRELAPDAVRIVLTGYADVNAAVGAINRGGVFRFVVKPWDNDEFKITIVNAVKFFYLSQRNEQLSRELKKKSEEMKKLNAALEWIISEKTSELMLQNRTAAFSQVILHALPAAVLCVNADNVIILCNQRCKELLMKTDMSFAGRAREDMLPRELIKFIDAVVEQQAYAENLVMDGRSITAQGRSVKYENAEEGVVLVLSESKP